MNDAPLRFAVLAEDLALARLLQEAFDETEVKAELALTIEATFEAGADQLASLRWAGAQIILGQVGGDPPAVVDALRRVATEAPGTIVMLAGPNLPSDALLKVMRAGAVEYLPGPVTPSDVSDAVRRVLRRRAAWEGEGHRQGHTYAIFGAKGGSGVTTSAVNLALELRRLTGEPTLLLDLDLLDGGAEVQLDLQARYTLVDLIGSFHRLDEGLLHSFVLTHSSGLDVVAAPRTALEGEKLTPEEVAQLVRVLRVHYTRVVMDVGNVLTSVALSALSEADQLALVVTPHLECLRNAKRVTAALAQRASRPKQDTHVVLNRHVPDPPIAIDEIERALGSPVRTILPLDDAMMRRSACGGRPAVLAGSSKYGKHIRTLAFAVGQLEEPTDGAGFVRSWLGGLLHRNGNGNGKSAPAVRRVRTLAGR